MEAWVAYFGLPLELHADRAKSFESKIWSEMCDILGIKRTRSVVMHPMGNAVVERTQQTLVNMLNCVCASNPFSWSKLIKLCALAYNNLKHKSIKMEPAKLIFGRLLCLPPDLILPNGNTNHTSELMSAKCADEYVLRLQALLRELNAQARANLKNATFKNGKYYNNRLAFNKFDRGDLVYYFYPVKNQTTSKSNFHPWKGPFVVLDKMSDCLYKIQESAQKKPLITHHNKLKKATPREPIDTSWIDAIPNITSVEVEISDDFAHTDNDRPKRTTKSPDRLGNYLYY